VVLSGRDTNHRPLAHRPTTILAASDSPAVGAPRRVRAAALRVAGDAALVGFDEPVFADRLDRH
jgi:DNA-binding LacI/PurR family transcriptional regulator